MMMMMRMNGNRIMMAEFAVDLVQAVVWDSSQVGLSKFGRVSYLH